TFLLTLTSQPTATVSIPLTATTGECTVWPATAMLDAGNWSTGVTATVTAVDDDIDDGPQACLVETGRSQSDDPNYYHINPLDVDITVENDDEAGVVVTPTILTINEPDSSDTFVISLTSEPTETVFIALSLSNDECDVSPRSVVLAAGNWHAGATVTVTAQDDDLHDGSQICVVHTGPAHSAAPQYEGIEVDDITVTVQDDETIWHFYLPLVVRAWPPVPGVPVLHPISNSGGLGTYSITWDSAIRAETYVLEQAMTSSFDMSWQIYAGPATNHLASGQGAARYYYRVKARNSWGDSGWSHVEQVDVLWEAEPNDNGLTQANGPILSGLIYYGTFPDADDLQDYFYFDLSTPHSVELALSNIAGGENYNLVLRDASLENVVGYSALPGNANEYISIPELPAGRYYIQVYNFSQVGSDQPYHLHVVYE
ncbi:MAG: PPC domain-containing protein, partial [Anaerolineae bacterium]|nr:PPC domain-containing protein [Anaerolineae bacterium]